MRGTKIVVATLSLIFEVSALPDLVRRTDVCGQYSTVSSSSSPYTLYNNLWGSAAATSGYQCSNIDYFSPSTATPPFVSWHTAWTWVGGPWNTKAYTNIVRPLSSIRPISGPSAWKSLETGWTYTYSGTSPDANVAYDLFTASTAGGNPEYEIMMWLSALGGAGPIDDSGKPIATVKLAGVMWDLIYGVNGDSKAKVYSFVATDAKDLMKRDFQGDLMEFLNYLVKSQGVPASQLLLSIGAGTETFTGTNCQMSTSKFYLNPQ